MTTKELINRLTDMREQSKGFTGAAVPLAAIDDILAELKRLQAIETKASKAVEVFDNNGSTLYALKQSMAALAAALPPAQPQDA